MTRIKYIDEPPAGWHALDVMKSTDGRKWDWCALMIDVHPDELKHCLCQDSLSVRPSGRISAGRKVRIPGKHRTWEAAWDALRRAFLSQWIMPLDESSVAGQFSCEVDHAVGGRRDCLCRPIITIERYDVRWRGELARKI